MQMQPGASKPLLLGDGPGEGVDAAGQLNGARDVAADHRADQRKRDDDKHEDAHNQNLRERR